MRVREILERAIDAIRVQGWHDGGLVGPNSTVCLLGGILLAQGYTVEEIRSAAVGYPQLNKEAVKLVADRVLATQGPSVFCCEECAPSASTHPEEICYDFNDATDEEAVIDVLKDAVGHAPID